jgi:pimeloyl-ACP methyl ester carboxylesterase
VPATRTDDGVTISYRVRGDGRRNLLFMHGWAGSGAYYDETLEHLDLTGLRAITVDLRGHAESDKTENGYTLDRFERDVLAVADQVGAAKMVVVGFGMSGKFAQYVALSAPDRVVGQVLIAPSPASKLPFPTEAQRDWVDRVGNREKLREVTAMFISQPVRPAVLDRWADDAAREFLGWLWMRPSTC